MSGPPVRGAPRAAEKTGSTAKVGSLLNRKALAAAFPITVPVLMGYLSIGIAFGLMLEAAGYNVIWAFFMSLTIYAGSGQYLGVELLATGAVLSQVALLTFLINFRHLVYGLSMLEKFRGMGKRKLYMIFSLTDETYALLAAGGGRQGFLLCRGRAGPLLLDRRLGHRLGGGRPAEV